MKTTYKMKEATNKEEAIKSIIDVMEQNPLWTNKCTSNMYATILSLGSKKQRKYWLTKYREQDVVDLFVELKTEYYNFKDNTQWNY